MSNIIELHQRCDHCGRGLRRRPSVEGRRFCSYQCGINEQPAFVATTMRNTGSGNDPSTHQ